MTNHAVCWLWPNTCLLRYPDFFFETAELQSAEVEVRRYVDEVLQVQDVDLVESVQRGMRTPAFDQGRIVCDASGTGLSEHGVHHFHGLVLDACRALAGGPAGQSTRAVR